MTEAAAVQAEETQVTPPATAAKPVAKPVAKKASKKKNAKKAKPKPKKAEAKEAPAPAKHELATPIIISRIGLEVEASNTWRFNVPADVTPEQCMDEGFYAHVGIRLQPGDTLRILPDTMLWELVLHVINAGREFAQVTQKHFYDYEEEMIPRTDPSRYSVDFAGSTDKYRLLLDGRVLKKGLATKALAERAAQNHQMAVDMGKKAG